jgi:peptidyl-prolyl cis-trans isomerase C
VYYSRGIKLLTLVVCAMSLFACKPSSEVETKKDGKVLAEVNGKAITAEDFNAEVENLPPVVRQMAQSPEGKKELIDGMIFRELVLEQAKKDGIDKSKDVAARLESVKKMVIVEAFVRKKLEQDVKISDEEMKQFYETNKDKFKTGEQLRTSHILVKSEQAAQDILAQLKKGANFEELARKYSVDGSAAKGGDLGWFSKGTMVPDFEQAAWNLKEGEISGIVKTQYGFHIIKVTGKRPAGIRSYEEVKDQIRAAMLPSKQQQVLQNLKEDLKKDAKISIKEDDASGVGTTPAEKAPLPSASSK